MRSTSVPVLGCLLVAAISTSALAEVTASAPHSFDVTLEASVKRDADSVWDALIEDTGMWWDPAQTLSGEPQNVTLEPWAGGCICEALNDGGSVRQLEVVLVSRDSGILQAIGGLGPLRNLPVSGIFTFTVEKQESGGTKIGLTYKVSGGGEVGPLAAQVDELLSQQLARLAHWIDHESPTPQL